MKDMPRWLVITGILMVILSWVPLALVIRARTVKSPNPPLHVVPDMDNQPKFKAQARNMMFADRRAMRPPVEGTVARGELNDDDALYRGLEGETWVAAMPVEVDRALLERGRQRYDIFCSPCHGLAGYGDGAIAKRADALQQGTWTPPSSLHTDVVRGRADGHLYNTIVNGIRNMPGYGTQIPVEDRWAVVAYMRALQRSQNASVDDVPADLRTTLR
jgi:mono/diheme cytochrome c family protein